MLTVRELRKCYGTVAALDGVSFDLEPGRVVATIGANGSGKTTLLKCVLGLVHFEGSVVVDGLEVAKQGALARHSIGYLPQNAAFHPELSVEETALFYANLRKASADHARAAVETMGLLAVAQKPVGTLSGGMRQRLGLAVALLNDPPYLLLDEPASSLDVAARIELHDLIRRLAERGTAILISTHWLEDLPQLADSVLVLDQGKVLFYGPCEELTSSGALTARLFFRLNGQTNEAMRLLGSFASVVSVEAAGDWLIVSCAAKDRGRIIEGLIGADIRIQNFHAEDAPLDSHALSLIGRAQE